MSSFPKFRPRNCPFFLKTSTHCILEVLIWYPDLDFWNSDPEIHFWANLGRKSQSFPYWLKIGTQSILRILIFIPTLIFSISNLKSIFGKFWARNFKVVHFDWKLAHMVYWVCWFLFWHHFSRFTNLNPFLGRVRPTKWNCSCSLFYLMLLHIISRRCWFISSETCNWGI